MGLAPAIVTIASAQTGNGVTTNIADRGTAQKPAGTIIRIITIAGATPTCTYAIEVSADGSVWTAATYADIGTPTTDVAVTFALTSSTTVQKIVKMPAIWRYVRVTFSANTNMTNTVDVLFSDAKKLIP